MSVAYRAINWDRQKKIYDKTLAIIVALVLGGFVIATVLRLPNSTAETMIIRGLALSSFMLLNVILCIGPLARLDPCFLPLLYNRRHLGVTMFTLALAHAAFSIFQFHALGDRNPLVSALTGYHIDYWPWARTGGRFSDFPFEPFGAAALVILFLMAATSHDFWLKHLGASVWKTLHLLVYFAYGLIVAHVALGVLQSERNPLLAILAALSLAIVIALHLLAARKGLAFDRQRTASPEADDYAMACRVDELVENRGKTVIAAKKRIAIYLRDGKVYALSNVCRHQGGPIGEGCIVDGAVTCPWHGWQYKVEDGVSPPPFAEKIPTYPVRVTNGVVYVLPRPNPLGEVCAGAQARTEPAHAAV